MLYITAVRNPIRPQRQLPRKKRLELAFMAYLNPWTLLRDSFQLIPLPAGFRACFTVRIVLLPLLKASSARRECCCPP